VILRWLVAIIGLGCRSLRISGNTVDQTRVEATAEPDRLVLRVGTTQILDSPNPYQTGLLAGQEATHLGFDTLTAVGDDGSIVPGFAESWTREGAAWTFTIRTGMLWSDGQPATADDACFSWQLYLDAARAGSKVGAGYLDPAFRAARVTSVDCVDDTTLVVTTEDESERILSVNVPIIPRHVHGEHTFETIGTAPFDPPLVGSGPYVLVRWQEEDLAHFDRNPNYWGSRGAAEAVTLLHLPGENALITGLRSGDLDYVRGAPVEQFDALNDEPDIETARGREPNSYWALVFNTRGSGGGAGGSTLALTDSAFRDALGWALDKSAIVSEVLLDFGTVGDTILPPHFRDWHATPGSPRSFDLEAAARRLDEAGYAVGGDGWRMDTEGNALNLRLTWPDTEARFVAVAALIGSWFGDVGIRVDAAPSATSELVRAISPAESGGSADFDMFLWSWHGDPDPSSLLSTFTSEQIGALNDSYFSDSDYDGLFSAQLQVTGAARQEIIRQMQELVYDAAPCHVICYADELHAYRTARFSSWQAMAPNGTPLFAYGSAGYTVLSVVETAVAAPVAPASAPVGRPVGIAVDLAFDQLDIVENAVRPIAKGTTLDDSTLSADSTAIQVGDLPGFAGPVVVATEEVVYVILDEDIKEFRFVGTGTAASVRGNALDSAGAGPVAVVATNGKCIFAENFCTLPDPAERDAPSPHVVQLAVESLVLSGNQVRAPRRRAGTAVDATVLGATGGPAATVLGNITDGAIRVNGATLGTPWAPLNIQTS
jgi:peptide/nickel transport system substrate-binding protein